MNPGLPGKIFTDMRADIIMDAYPVGSKLPPERELSIKYGASRFAVREAIAMLAQAGFVATYPQSGTYVRDFYNDGTLDTLVQVLRVKRTIDRQTLESLMNFRYTTETAAAAEAAERITDRDIESLELHLIKKSENLGNIRILAECDYDFHYKVISISGNIINRLVFQSFRPVYSFFTEYFYSIEGAPASSLLLNQKLMKHLRMHDPVKAGKAMGDILRFGEKKVYEAMKNGKEVLML